MLRETIVERTLDFLVHRAAQQRGKVRIDLAEIRRTLHARYPSDPSPTLPELSAALRILQARRLVQYCGGQWIRVRNRPGLQDPREKKAPGRMARRLADGGIAKQPS